MSQPPLDGNALAGALSEVFRVDVTSAIGECAHCRRRGPMAETVVYANAPGMVARCPGGDAVVLRALVPGQAGFVSWLTHDEHHAGPQRAARDLAGMHGIEAATAQDVQGDL